MGMLKLFSPLQIGKKIVSNRFVYQATETNNCDGKGAPTEETLRIYKSRAEGSPAIVFIESIDVSWDCQARSNRMVLTHENKEEYRELIQVIKSISPETLVVFQISHAGSLSDPQFKAPIHVYDGDGKVAISTEEVIKARDDFISASLIVDEIGGDGVDIKQAHGFLAGDFLHPKNNRNDQYGGNFENRTRFFTEIFSAVKEKCSIEFVIGTRISPYEGIPGGCGTPGPECVIEDLSEMIAWAVRLEEMGLDFINVSAGYASANLEILLPTATFPEGVYRHFTWTSMIKNAVSIPVIGSGYTYPADGNNDLTGECDKKSLLYFAEQNLNSNIVDLIGIGRQVIADPLFVKKVSEGNISEVNWCSACSGCGILLGNNKSVGCTVYEDEFKNSLEEVL